MSPLLGCRRNQETAPATPGLLTCSSLTASGNCPRSGDSRFITEAVANLFLQTCGLSRALGFVDHDPHVAGFCALLSVACMGSRAQEVACSCATHPGLVNQELAGAHGFDLGMETFGPLILSVPSTLRGHSHPSCPDRADAGTLRAAPPHGARREVVRGEFALFNDAQYTVDLFSVPHLVRRLLGANANLGEATLLWVPCQCSDPAAGPRGISG